jgi:hypothetical protein
MLWSVLRGLEIMNVGMEWEKLASDHPSIFGKFKTEIRKEGGNTSTNNLNYF